MKNRYNINVKQKRFFKHTGRKHGWIFLFNVGIGKDFLNMTQNPEAIKKKRLTSGQIKIKIFMHDKKHHKQSQTTNKLLKNACNINLSIIKHIYC